MKISEPFSSIVFLLLILLLTSCQQETKEYADAIWYNGSILTMEGDFPEYVAAIAVKDKKILALGELEEINTIKVLQTVFEGRIFNRVYPKIK